MLLLFIVLFPLGSILIRAFDEAGSTWNLITEYYLNVYMLNSLFLVFGVGLSCLLIGVLPAWLVANYNFPGRRIFKLGLILPLTIPSYIMAYTYSGIFDSTGTLQQLVTSWWGQEVAASIYFDFLNPWSLIILLSFCFYPYVYTASLVSFSANSSRHLDTAASLGAHGWKRLFKIGLPMAIPAILAGLFLVLMEVLNEYGAVQYFNFRTFTTGIFSAWENGDLTSAVRVALMLFCLALVFLLLTRRYSRKATIVSSDQIPTSRQQLTGWKKVAAFVFCLTLILLAFFIPFAQLTYWSSQTWVKVVDSDFLALIWNTVVVSVCAVIIIIGFALLLLYSGNLVSRIGGHKLASLGTLGYSIPGAIIAVGIMVPFIAIDKITGTEILLGTVAGLLIAYLIRFTAVAYGPMKGKFRKQGYRLDEASRTLNVSPLKSLFKVHIPMLWSTFGITALIVFVDVMKELPITLIMRPTNYDTLATEAYRYAQTNESAVQAAPASILLILIGILPVVLLSRSKS